jgi:MarR family 2-MHQ and catechol resistance regulon transcriptional repressor
MPTHYEGSEEEVSSLNAYIKLMRASNAVTRRLTPTIASSGLTLSQFGVLETLHHIGPMCQRELSDKLLLSGGNITMVVNNLEKQGLVVRLRTGSDKRYSTVHLTWRGTQMIKELFPKHLKEVVRIFTVLTAEEMEGFGKACRRVGKGV